MTAGHDQTVDAGDVATMLASYFSPAQLVELRAGAGAMGVMRTISRSDAGVWGDFADILDLVLARAGRCGLDDVDQDHAAGVAR